MLHVCRSFDFAGDLFLPLPCADTSLTNFFAFLLGSASSLPAVEYFCNYACTAILFDFVLQARQGSEPHGFALFRAR